MGFDFLRLIRPALAVSTTAVLFSACQQPTQITLEILTDISCSAKPSTAIVVGSKGAEGTSANTATSMCTDDRRIGAIVLLPHNEKDETIFIRVVTGVGFTAEECLINDHAVELGPDDPIPMAGCITARRTLNFIPSTPLYLPITMRANCLGVRCEPGTTCAYNRDCVPDEIKDPNLCTNPDGCDLPQDNPPISGSSSSNSSSSGMSNSTSSSSSSGMGGTGGMGGMGGGASSSSSTGMGGTGGTGGASSSSSSTGMGGTGGAGGASSSSSSTGMGGTGGTGGTGGGASSSSSGTTTADAGTMVVTLVPEIELIPPGTLVVDETYFTPPQRKAVPKESRKRTYTPLLLPLNTYPRNVKP